MSTMFERFAKMAREQFGCTIVKTTEPASSFKSLFGIDVSSLAQYKLPYDSPSELCEYDPVPSCSNNNVYSLCLNSTPNNFGTTATDNLAA